MRNSRPPYSRKPIAAEIDTTAMKADDMILNSARVPSLCARPARTHSTACTAYTTALKTMNMGLSEAVGRLRACNQKHCSDYHEPAPEAPASMQGAIQGPCKGLSYPCRTVTDSRITAEYCYKDIYLVVYLRPEQHQQGVCGEEQQARQVQKDRLHSPGMDIRHLQEHL